MFYEVLQMKKRVGTADPICEMINKRLAINLIKLNCQTLQTNGNGTSRVSISMIKSMAAKDLSSPK